MATEGAPHDCTMREYQLADGTGFSCWSSMNQEGKPCYIWSDCPHEIFYRLVLNGKPGEWKPLLKHEVFNKHVGPTKVVRHPKGKPGAIEVLARGRYKVEFKIGDQLFTEPPLYLSIGPATNADEEQ